MQSCIDQVTKSRSDVTVDLNNARGTSIMSLFLLQLFRLPPGSFFLFFELHILLFLLGNIIITEIITVIIIKKMSCNIV